MNKIKRNSVHSILTFLLRYLADFMRTMEQNRYTYSPLAAFTSSRRVVVKNG